MTSQPGKAPSIAPERRRRRHPRYRSNFPVVLTLFAEGEYQHLDAHCRDLSQAGIGILLAAELVLGEVVTLSFTLPDRPEKWEVRTVIRHRRGYHYGCEFLALAAQQRDLLLQFVQGLERADED
jgi:hypothetical protein